MPKNIDIHKNYLLFNKFIFLLLITLYYQDTDKVINSKTITSSDKNLCNDINLTLEFCSQNLGIPRSQMPQINITDLKNAYGNLIKTLDISITDAYSTQSEIDAQKVDQILAKASENNKSPCNTNKEPIIISSASPINKHFFVVDGHHRAAACYLYAKQKGELGEKINALVVKDNIINVLKNTKSFKSTTYKNFRGR